MTEWSTSRELEGGARDTAQTTRTRCSRSWAWRWSRAEPGQLGACRRRRRHAATCCRCRPELVHHVRENDYVRGYVDGVGDLAGASGCPDGCARRRRPVRGPPASQFFRDTTELTWGIQAVGAQLPRSVRPGHLRRGAGHRVRCRRTPTSRGRAVTMQSFVPGESAGGRARPRHPLHRHRRAARRPPRTGPRYGVAHGGDDLRRQGPQQRAGPAADGGILAGIDWAIASGLRGDLDVAGRRRAARASAVHRGRQARPRQGSPSSSPRPATTPCARSWTSASSGLRRTARSSWPWRR